MTSFSDVIAFWFDELEPSDWWTKSIDFDQSIADRFGALHAAAAAGELWQWRREPLGRLAEILVLDQFSRNMFRDRSQAFAHDAMALALAQEAVAQGDDQPLSPPQRCFLYMPYMHSESRVVHEEAMRLFDQPGLEKNLDFERRHKVIIDQFGRYPHRNAILGRSSTPEEAAFLAQPGSSF